ncbi:unnamed protein product [Pocillopora meandrina]|uniref:Uncharacterized protein n=1 Tax=Pocillopora meandrina TaxID=46732 RepID=A0AAU9WIT9_9CNID|nr:unnamed protein product [Pocillopora meandrina]
MAEQRTMSTGEEKGPKTAGTSFIEGDIYKTPEDFEIIEAKRDYTVSDAFGNRASGTQKLNQEDERIADDKNVAYELREQSRKNKYHYAAGELEGGQRRATDPIWSLKVFNIEKSFVNKEEPVLYYLKDESKRGFVIEALQIFPPGTGLPSKRIR